MRSTRGFIAVVLALAGCASAGKRASGGLEPKIELTDVYVSGTLVSAGSDRSQARLSFEISNPNDWPMTLIRIQAELAGDMSARSRPEVESLRLQIAGKDSEEVILELDVTRIRPRSFVRPGTGSPPEQPPPDRPFSVDLRVRAFFRTPHGTVSHSFVKRRILQEGPDGERS
jgi:hypothetical protein